MALALYRKYRPRTFDEIIGQQHIVKTLKNSITNGEIHHAYLFLGERGSGKTSLAKIFSAALNVEGGPRVDFNPEDPVVAAIARDEYLDVMEIDAASASGLDDMDKLKRTMGEGLEFAPVLGDYKVYILDECHMLSEAAWNSMLKTLEEPPPGIIFVMCTTEAHLIPQTITDRCQKFYFQLPTAADITFGVTNIAAAEQIQVDDDAMQLIARSSNGSFRGALGNLEQLRSFVQGARIHREDVYQILKVSDEEWIFEALGGMVDGDPGPVLQALDKVVGSGKNTLQFMEDFMLYLRWLQTCRIRGEVPSEIVTEASRQQFALWAEQLTDGQILLAYELLMEHRRAFQMNMEARMQVEMAFLMAVAAISEQQYA